MTHDDEAAVRAEDTPRPDMSAGVEYVGVSEGGLRESIIHHYYKTTVNSEALWNWLF